MSIAIVSSSIHDQDSFPTSVDCGSTANTNLYVGVLSRGVGSSCTGVTFNSVSLTKMGSISSSTVGAGEEYSIWILLNASGNHTLDATFSGVATATRFSSYAFSGTDQVTGYEGYASQDHNSDTPTTISVTSTRDNSFIWGYFPNGAGTLTADSNTTFPDATIYEAGYSTAAQTPAGSHAIGYTNNSVSVIQAVVVMPLLPNNGDFLMFM